MVCHSSGPDKKQIKKTPIIFSIKKNVCPFLCYFFVLDSYLRYNSCFSKIRPDTKIPIPANRIDHDNHLTDFPTEPDYQHDSRPVAVKPLNLQQATSDHPVNSPEIVADKSLQTECQVEHHKILTTAERRRLRQRERDRRRERKIPFPQRVVESGLILITD